MSQTQLELQVVSESQAAIDALNDLEAALRGVQNAISDGLKDYEDFTKDIQEFSNALDEAISEDTVEKYENLANSLTTLQVISKMSFDSSGIAGFAEEINEIASGLNQLDLINIALKTVGPAIGQTLGNVLGHFFSSGAETIETVWNITTNINNESVDEKADGWMIEEILSKAFGSTLAGDLKSQIMETGSGSVDVSVTFGVTAEIALDDKPSVVNDIQASLDEETFTVNVNLEPSGHSFSNDAVSEIDNNRTAGIIRESTDAVEEITKSYQDIINEAIIKDLTALASSPFSVFGDTSSTTHSAAKTIGAMYDLDGGEMQRLATTFESLIDYVQSGLISIDDYKTALTDLLDSFSTDTSGMAGMAESSYNFAQDITTSANNTHNDVEEAISSIESRSVASPDISGFTSGMSKMSASASYAVSSIRNSLRSLNNISVSFSSGLLGGFTSIRMAASGGQFNSGEMFIARENGIPEMIGQIGNKATVANNDQIVAGISSGVASGQAEQNALLRRQNDILIQLLNKKFTAEVFPSAALGKTVRRSEEMYERNAGV